MKLLIWGILLYGLLVGLLYLYQESLLFHPERLAHNYRHQFSQPFSEINVAAEDGTILNGVLFPADSSPKKRPLVFFLHGNSGNILGQEGIAAFYHSYGYDFFSFDYRGFGKSGGQISSEAQFYSDVRTVYRTLSRRYPQDRIVVIGYSVGTASAAMLASENRPRQLILIAPYYSMEDMASRQYPFAPSFIVAYKFETFHWIRKTTVPITLFHGTDDGAIPFESSQMLSALLREDGRFIPLKNCGHTGMEEHPVFIEKMGELLAR